MDSFSTVIESVKTLFELIVDSISNFVDFASNIFTTIQSLFFIFPYEVRPILVSFLSIAVFYLIYKLIRGA